MQANTGIKAAVGQNDILPRKSQSGCYRRSMNHGYHQAPVHHGSVKEARGTFAKGGQLVVEAAASYATVRRGRAWCGGRAGRGRAGHGAHQYGNVAAMLAGVVNEPLLVPLVQ